MGLMVLLAVLVTVLLATATAIENTTARTTIYWLFLPPLIIGLITIWSGRWLQ